MSNEQIDFKPVIDHFKERVSKSSFLCDAQMSAWGAISKVNDGRHGIHFYTDYNDKFVKLCYSGDAGVGYLVIDDIIVYLHNFTKDEFIELNKTFDSRYKNQQEVKAARLLGLLPGEPEARP